MPAVDPVVIEMQLRSLRAERELGRFERMVGSSASRMTGLLAGVSVAALGREFLSFADTAKQLEAQLRLATQTFGTFGKAQADTLRIAAETRSSLEATTSLYGNLTRATQNLGGTQDQAGRATETFSKALKLGGAGAQEAASATLQFGQALASGALRGDEFNSIAEASPRLLRLIAEAVGVPQGALRKLAEEGKLTSDVLFRALTDRRFTAGIDAEFKTLPVTFEEAMGQVKNAAIVTFGAFDRGGEFSNALSSFVSDGSDGFSNLETSAAQLGIQIRSEFAGLSNAFEPLLDGALSVFKQINASSAESAAYIRGFLSTIDSVANFAKDRFNDAAAGARQGVVVAAGNISPITGTLANRLLPAATPIQGKVNFTEPFERDRRRSQRDGDIREGTRIAAGIIDRTIGRDRLGRDDLARIDTVLNELRARRNESSGRNIKATSQQILRAEKVRDGIARGLTGTQLRKELGIETGVASPRAPESGKKKGPKGPSAETLARREEAERQRDLGATEAFLNERDSINQDILRAKQSLATAAETVARYELDEIEGARLRANRGYQADVERASDPTKKALAQTRANELIARNDELAVARRSIVEAREKERKLQEAAFVAAGTLENERDLLAAQADLAVTAKDRRQKARELFEIETRIARQRLIEEAEAADRAKDVTRAQYARDRLAALDARTPFQRAQMERDNAGSLQTFRRGLDDPATDIEDAVAQKLQDVDDAIADAAANTLGVKDPFLKRLLQIFLEQNVLKPLYDAAASGGNAGGFLGSIIKAVPTIFGRASGGYVGPRQTVRVNEQRGGMELLRMGSQGGTVIPLGEAAGMQRMGGAGTRMDTQALARSMASLQSTPLRSAPPPQPTVIKVYADEGAMFVPRVEQISGTQTVQIFQQAAPGLIQASSARARMDAQRDAKFKL